jgi:hypothetical protein
VDGHRAGGTAFYVCLAKLLEAAYGRSILPLFSLAKK